MPNQLYLPDWTVLAVRETDRYDIDATYDIAPTDCLKCGLVDAPLYKHGGTVITLVDAPVHGLQTFINVRRARYRCRECLGTFVQPLPDVDENRRMMKRCVTYIQKQCLLRPNTNVAEDVGVDEKVVRQIGWEQADRLSADHAFRIRAPRVLGIDELFLGDEMRAIFVNGETSWPIELLADRYKGTVTNFLMNLPGRKETEIVTMDMWKPYREAVQYAMPQAVIIIDKWHVMRMANDAMDIARRRYQGLLSVADRKTLKARKAMFLKRPYKLSPREQLDLDGWLKNTPELRGAYECKEAFMDIWKHRKRERAKQALDQWRATIPAHLKGLFGPVARTTVNWEPEILNYFDNERRTNAPTEARNRVIKMTNRMGAGYSFAALRARALFGKRRSRLKAEAAAGIITMPVNRMRRWECSCCKAVWESESQWPGDEIYVNGHVFEIAAACRDCVDSNTTAWFDHDDDSTVKSE